MPRILFEKKGNAVWISHLDLMRLFQRAFKRAGLPLKHTQGFNPRPFVSIALPLSVGVESSCELLDFELDGENVPCDEIMDRLNQALVEGVQVKCVYEGGRKIKELALLSCEVYLEYDNGIPENALPAVCALFGSDSIVVEKKGKNGIVQQDIMPMIKHLDAAAADSNTLKLNALVCCQNPSLNPAQLCAAISKYLPECAPNFSRISRLEIFDGSQCVFR